MKYFFHMVDMRYLYAGTQRYQLVDHFDSATESEVRPNRVGRCHVASDRAVGLDSKRRLADRSQNGLFPTLTSRCWLPA